MKIVTENQNPQCAHSPCICTLWIPLGAEQYICWYHLLVHYGKAGSLLWNELPKIGLEASVDA